MGVEATPCAEGVRWACEWPLAGEEGAAGVLDDVVRPGGETTMEGEGQKNGRSPLKLTLRLPRLCMTISLGFFYSLPQWNPGMPD